MFPAETKSVFEAPPLYYFLRYGREEENNSETNRPYRLNRLNEERQKLNIVANKNSRNCDHAIGI